MSVVGWSRQVVWGAILSICDFDVGGAVGIAPGVGKFSNEFDVGFGCEPFGPNCFSDVGKDGGFDGRHYLFAGF